MGSAESMRREPTEIAWAAKITVASLYVIDFHVRLWDLRRRGHIDTVALIRDGPLK